MRLPWRHESVFPDPTEAAAIIAKNVALATGFDEVTRERHLALTAALVENKHWEAVTGLELTSEIITTIAANAAIPILGLDPWLYRHVQWIVVHPSTTTSHGLRGGPTSGVVDDRPAAVIGEASASSGPVLISWDAAIADSREPHLGRNVVIHEFAHKIDMSDGYADGNPPLRGPAAVHWADVLADEYEHAEARPSDLVLRPYAWTNPAEFFAVATEAFFCRPKQLLSAKPDLYAALSDFYAQEPAAR